MDVTSRTDPISIPPYDAGIPFGSDMPAPLSLEPWHLPTLLAPSTPEEQRVQELMGPTIDLVERGDLDVLVKRALDLGASLAGLLMFSPLLIGVALVIKATSPGPVFFTQVRVGIGGRLFRLFKFRTMVPNAEELKADLEGRSETTGPVFKIRRDPRVTRFGSFLRRYSLDELPQLLNVLRGEMSLVGPRPPVPGEVVKYEGWQLRRLSVTPGLTCIWQTSGRSRLTFEEWMEMDLRYIDEWSLALDARLIARTFKAVLSADGAY